MRVAVLSDVHGFDLALQVVLADIDEQGPFDAVVVAGDLCELGPAPKESLDLLRSRGYPMVQGNTDLAIVEGAASDTSDPELCYAIDRLTSADIDFLANLPFSHRITPPDGVSPDEDLLVVHATPQSLTDQFNPLSSDDTLLAQIGGARAAVIAFGHLHVCYVREVGETLLVDVSAVGNSKDGDLRCKYGILTWHPMQRRWSPEMRKLPYPIEATAEQITACGVPDAKKVIRKLQRATFGGGLNATIT